MDKAEALWAEMAGGNANPSEVSWDDKWAITFLVMYDITGKVTNQYLFCQKIFSLINNKP